MEQSVPREPSTQQRFDRRTFVALAGEVVAPAMEARVACASRLLRAAGTAWELPAHDLAATRHGGRILGTRVNWRADLEGGVAGAPAIVDGQVFAASIGGVVASFDLRTGRARWRRSFPTAVYGSGAGARRLGYFGGGRSCGRPRRRGLRSGRLPRQAHRPN